MNIYSPEFDRNLITSLKKFNYPSEFKDFENIIIILSSHLVYRTDTLKIEIFNGDAREYIKNLSNIDIVYQDAFSSDVNYLLWTVEYFNDIKKTLAANAIITTYSIATPIRLSIYENDFTIYEYKPDNSNRITIALNKKEIDPQFRYIDMKLKKQRNISALPLYD